MPKLTSTLNANVYGRQFTEDQSVTGDNGWDIGPVTLDAAKAATLSLRSDDDTGELTFADAAHGFLAGDKLDIYWSVSGGGVHRTAVVGVVAGAVVPIDTGVGDVLPPQGTAVTVSKQRDEGAQAIPVANIVGVGMNAPIAATTFIFRNAANAEVLVVVLPAGQSYIWTTESGIANPFLAASTLAKVSISQGGTAQTQPTAAAVVYN